MGLQLTIIAGMACAVTTSMMATCHVCYTLMNGECDRMVQLHKFLPVTQGMQGAASSLFVMLATLELDSTGGCWVVGLSASACILLCVVAGLMRADMLPEGWQLMYTAPPGTLETITYMQHVSAPSCSTRYTQVYLPAGMTALRKLDMPPVEGVRCTVTWLWFPASSAANVRTLCVSEMLLRRIPGNLPSLQELDVSNCTWLCTDLLPATCASTVRVLDVGSTSLCQILPGMHKLQEIDVNHCRSLSGWLPLSYAAKVRKLCIANSSLARVPEHSAPPCSISPTPASDERLADFKI